MNLFSAASPLIEVQPYDWTWFWITAVVVSFVAIVGGIWLAVIVEDAWGFILPFCAGFLVMIFVGIFAQTGSSNLRAEQKILALNELGYTYVEPRGEGYNQYVASKDGEFVKIALTDGPSDDTYYVLEIQE